MGGDDQLALFAWEQGVPGCRNYGAKSGTLLGKLEWLVLLSPTGRSEFWPREKVCPWFLS